MTISETGSEAGSGLEDRLDRPCRLSKWTGKIFLQAFLDRNAISGPKRDVHHFFCMNNFFCMCKKKCFIYGVHIYGGKSIEFI